MDVFDEAIVKTLRDGKPRRFQQILEEMDFSHNTLRHHLESLVDQGLVTREKKRPRGPGRPVFLYSMPRESRRKAFQLLPDPHGDVVSLFFRSLRQVCKHEKGGYCKKMRAGCEAKNCPQTLE